MPKPKGIALFFVFFTCALAAQLPVARDTITVREGGRVLVMPWGGGINSANVSNIDLNFDQKMDLVVFDKQNTYNIGRFRCFINTGSPGSISYRHEPALSYFFPECASWAVLHDYDQDGKADIFCSTNSGIKVFRNTSVPQAMPSFSLASALLESNYFPGSNPPSVSNLFASSAGVPGIGDADNDGDLDIMTFSPLGVFLELHRNMSQELYGDSDHLEFQRDDNCWGNLSESECSVSFETCESQLQGRSAKPYHAGSCITCIDSDGDLDQDLIMGDMNCDFVHYVHNTGTGIVADFSDTTRLYPNFPAKNAGATLIRISYFPCAYAADVDADGRKDLLASPNAIGSENFNSLWLYRNTSATGTVNFQLAKKNFLQDEMIEVGQNAFPLLFDYDNDGRKDLLVGTQGYFAPGQLDARLALYRNTGSAAVPAFSLITRDLGSLDANNLYNAIPAAGDVDGDGDNDILIGTSSGQVHWLENTAGAGKPCSFAPLKLNPFNFTTSSAAAAPQLFDLDNDGKPDLLIGMKNGRIAYYRNTSTTSKTTFSLITSFLGGVDVKSDPTRYGLDGFAVPFFYKEGNSTFLLVGCVTGDVHQFSVNSISDNFVYMNARVNGLTEGSQSAPWYEDINADGKRDLFIGLATGGISFFSSASPYVGLIEQTTPVSRLKLFPIPVKDKLHIENNSLYGPGTQWKIMDVSGRMVHSGHIESEVVAADVSSLTSGIYIIELSSMVDGRVHTAWGKFVKE